METNLMEPKRYKVGLMFISVNEQYWPFVQKMIEGAKKYFLPHHDVEFLFWSDMPPEITYGAKRFEIEPVEWPYPTLLRYHVFLREEEELRKYDYLFYIDVDMVIADTITDEILGDGLTAALHPMYALQRHMIAPYEPNPDSTAYIRVPDYYYAGGFQGGKTEAFIKAMWTMKRNIDIDFHRNYRARWNDESHWNRYLFDNPPAVILGPEYIYPDTLIKEHYVHVWGRDYKPKIITITKKFTLSKAGGDAVKKMIQEKNQ